MSETPLGFIGLGNMGGPMAVNLAAAGHALVCYDQAAVAPPPGAEAVASAAEVAARAPIVFLCLPDGPAVMSVVREIVAAEGRVEVVVDNTTAGVADACAAHEALAAAGIAYADAPVSGGTAGAKAGSLTMMVAAPEALYTRVAPFLQPMAKNARRVGSRPGQGMAMKLLNNFLSGMSMAATSEAVAFGIRQGLDMATVIDTLNVSTGRNTATSDKFPNRIATGAFDSGFATRLMAKDLRLYVRCAEESGAPHTLSALLRDVWNALEEDQPGSDFTRIYPFTAGD